MVEIAKCKCGADGRLLPGSRYTAVDCSCTSCWLGPIRTTGAEAIAAWNALMSPAAPEPAAGTVRVRIGYWRHHYCGHHLWDMELVPSDKIPPDVIITVDIPLPQPVEIPGTVESGS